MTVSDNHSPKKAVLITPPNKRKTRKEYAESDSAFRKMATTSRQQLYDLANPGKQLLKQLSSAGMAKAAYTNSVSLMSINQNALDVLGMNPALTACVNSATMKQLNFKAFDTFNASLCVDSASVARLQQKIGTIPNLIEISAAAGFDSASAIALAKKINPKAYNAATLGMAMSPQPDFFASEVKKLHDNSVAGWMDRLFLNPIEDYLGINSSLYLPSDSFVIRSTPKTKKQQERLVEFKKRDEAENTSIITPGQPDYQLALLEVAADTAKKSGLTPPKSLHELVSFLVDINQVLENQKPKIVEDKKPIDTGDSEGSLPKYEKRLVPIERGTTELLVLIYEVLSAFGVKLGDNLSKLTARAAWGMIIARKFRSDLIREIIGERKVAVLILNGGDEIDFKTFARTYTRRFK